MLTGQKFFISQNDFLHKALAKRTKNEATRLLTQYQKKVLSDEFSQVKYYFTFLKQMFGFRDNLETIK